MPINADWTSAAMLILLLTVAGALILRASGDSKEMRFLLAALLAVALFRLAYVAAGVVDLTGDEALYWEWSRRPDWSYYSKGPLIAYLIRSSTLVLGSTDLGVRAWAIVLSFGSSLLMYFLARRLWNKRVAMWSALLLQIIPIFAAFSVGMSIDPPLLFLWLASLLLFRRAAAEQWKWGWLWLGLLIGLGMHAKYSMALFYFCGLGFLAATADGRKQLRSPWPYLAVPVSLIVFFPVLYWNYLHGWADFQHNLVHTNLGNGFGLSGQGLLDSLGFIGSQFGVITPILLIFMIHAAWKLRRQDRLCFWFSLPLLGFFVLKSIQGKVQANWSLPAYPTMVIAFSAVYLRDFSSLNKHLKRLVTAGVIIAVVATAAIHIPTLLVPVHPIMARMGVDPSKDPLVRNLGWRRLAAKVDELYAGLDGPKFILSNRYLISSRLAFYMKGQPTVYCANTDRRMNQYDFWPTFHHLVHYNFVYISMEDDGMDDSIAKAIAARLKVHLVLFLPSGGKINDFNIYLCQDFKGMPVVWPTKY